MDTSALEKFCLSITDPADANGLPAAVRQRALVYRLDPQGPQVPADADSVDGRLLTPTEKAQRAALLEEIDGSPEAFAEVLRRAAYGWFNRVAAIRYMELHDFLPSHVRMLSRPGQPDGQWARPQCLDEAVALVGELPGIDAGQALTLADGAHDEELFALLLKAQCAQLAEYMPGIFGKVGATEALLLPARLLGESGLVRRMVCEIPESAWGSEEPDERGHKDNNAEVTGWLYQFYIAREKNDAFAGFKKGKKATPEKIGPATQLFTPDWIVRYMVQNSLGRLWMLNNPESGLAQQMEFYIAPEGDPGDFVAIEGPEDISLCDPACGSGHILAYAFDLLVEMYRERGYRDRDAARLIIEKNPHGFEISERAAQWAEFVLNMRACSLDRRFLARAGRPKPDVCVLEPVTIEAGELPFGCGLAANKKLLDALAHLTECGSLLAPTQADLSQLREAAETAGAAGTLAASDLHVRLTRALDICERLARTHTCVVANPPYMGSSNFDPWTSAWVKANYPDVKSDLCTCFIERGFSLAQPKGYSAMVTMQSWMFLGSFEKMREKLLAKATIDSMCHLGARAFDAIGGEVVATTATVFHNAHKPGVRGAYLRLVDLIGSDAKRDAALEAIQDPTRPWFHRADASTFKSIPGTPIAYWASEGMLRAFKNGVLGNLIPVKKGLDTGDNETYLRLWHEVGISKIGIGYSSSETFTADRKKWAPHDKGGDFRRWYGNNDWIINWENNGFELRHSKANLRSPDFYFSDAVTWSALTSGRPHFRFSDQGALSNTAGSSMFPNKEDIPFVLAYMNSSVVAAMLELLSPTLNYSAGPVGDTPRYPYEYDERTVFLSQQNVSFSKSDWDSFETSWDFKHHPLV